MGNIIPNVAVVVELLPSEGLFVARQLNGALLNVCRDTESLRLYLDDLCTDMLKRHEHVNDIVDRG